MPDSNSIFNDYAQLEVNLYNKNHDAAMVNLNNIISDLKMKRTMDNSYTEALIVYLFKRVKINFNDRKYEDVVQDCALLKDLGENLYKNKEIFIMHEHSLMHQTIIETEKRFKQAKIEFEYDEEIVSMTTKIKNIDVDYIYSRNTQMKPVVKKQKIC